MKLLKKIWEGRASFLGNERGYLDFNNLLAGSQLGNSSTSQQFGAQFGDESVVYGSVNAPPASPLSSAGGLSVWALAGFALVGVGVVWTGYKYFKSGTKAA